MSKKLYVGNLTYDTTEDNLVELFSEYGEVLSAQIIIDRETNRSRGFGFVEMAEGAEEAVNALNGQDYKGRNLTVNEARPREDRGGGGGGGRGGYGGRRRLRAVVAAAVVATAAAVAAAGVVVAAATAAAAAAGAAAATVAAAAAGVAAAMVVAVTERNRLLHLSPGN